MSAAKKAEKPVKKKGRPKDEDVKFPHPGSVPISALIEEAAKQLPSGSLVPEQKSRAYLRWFAQLFYTTDLNGITLTQMAKHPIFRDVGYDQLAKWSGLDGWTSQREALLVRVSEQLHARVADEVVKARMKELGELRKVSEKLLAKLLPEPHTYVEFIQQVGNTVVKVCEICGHPKSGCGDPFWGVSGDKLVTALAKLTELMMTMEGVVHDRVTQVVGMTEKKVDDGGVPLTATLTDDDARTAAHAVLRRRRALSAPTRTDEGDGDSADDEADSSVAPHG